MWLLFGNGQKLSPKVAEAVRAAGWACVWDHLRSAGEPFHEDSFGNGCNRDEHRAHRTLFEVQVGGQPRPIPNRPEWDRWSHL